MIEKPIQSDGRTTVFHSPEEAERARREEIWAMTPEARLRLLETLRAQQYPDGIPPELQPVVVCIPR
jgi:hypothetical protein